MLFPPELVLGVELALQASSRADAPAREPTVMADEAKKRRRLIGENLEEADMFLSFHHDSIVRDVSNK
jgi:hypothetical protein